MPSTVPTMDEFNALSSRVTALEQGGTQPPDPGPGPDPGVGVQAIRMADVVEKLGVNTFSSMDPNGNVWGSWPANYVPQSVIAALKWIVQDSGYAIGVREYHYSGRLAMQKQWFPQIVAAFPTMRNTICPGANMSPNDVGTMLQLAQDAANNIYMVEGLNEPNTDFGQGQIPVNVTMDIQNRVWNGKGNKTVAGPSVVFGLPNPGGWITGYFGNQMDAVNAIMHRGNGHYYPPGSPDVPGTGYSVNDVVGGLWSVYAKHDIDLTEFHPTLYNSDGNKQPGKSAWSQTRDSYYTMQTLFRVSQNGTRSLWWYALYDYGTTYICGLYPKDQNNPREAAYALRALCALCPDHGNNRRDFAPTKLDYTVTGKDANTTDLLCQSSDGRFYIMLWRALPEYGGVPIDVTFNFASKPSKLEEFDLVDIGIRKLTANYQAIQTNVSRDGRLLSHLNGSARVIRVTP